MARAETIDNVGEAGARGSSTCQVELPGSFHTWPSLLTNPTITSGSGAIHLHYNSARLRPWQADCLPLPYPVPEGRAKPQTQRRLPVSVPSMIPPPSPPCSWRDDRGGARVPPSAFSDSDREEQQEASSRQGPLPDLLPQNEHQSWVSYPQGAARREEEEQLQARSVADQLRAVGDQLNSSVLRAHPPPHWRDWRDACRGLLNFITQTLSTFYRLV